jgi:hypothetical protein
MRAIVRGYVFMRAWMVLAVLPLLTGCSDSDWNNLLSFGSSGGQPTAVASAAPAPAPAPVPSAPAQAAQPNPFCMGVARQDATTNDFDPSTQQKAVVQSYQQCVEIFGN